MIIMAMVVTSVIAMAGVLRRRRIVVVVVVVVAVAVGSSSCEQAKDHGKTQLHRCCGRRVGSKARDLGGSRHFKSCALELEPKCA